MKPLHSQSIALALLAVLSTCGPVLAGGRPFHVTAMGGLAISKLRNVDYPFGAFQSVKGPGAGVGLAWPLAASLEVQPEVLYMQKGISLGESEGVDESGTLTGTIETLHVVSAIEVPLLLRWEVPTGGRVHPVLSGGPFVSFEIAEQRKITGSQTTSQDSEILKNTDYGVVLGAGLELDAGPGRWILQGRYEAGLADLGTFSFYSSDHVHSGAWFITTGYRL